MFKRSSQANFRSDLSSATLFNVDPFDVHDHSAAVASLRAQNSFKSPLASDMLTIAAMGRELLGYAFTLRFSDSDVGQRVLVEEVCAASPGSQVGPGLLHCALSALPAPEGAIVELTPRIRAKPFYERIGFMLRTDGMMEAPISVVLGQTAAQSAIPVFPTPGV